MMLREHTPYMFLILICLGITYAMISVYKLTAADTTYEKEDRNSGCPRSLGQMSYNGKSSETTISRERWLQLFEFIPNNVRNCSELFNGNFELPTLFKVKLEEFEDIFKEQIIVTPWPKNSGFTAMFPYIYKMAITVASFPFVKTICETGFNTGHSTFGWLQANPNTQVYSFDLGKNDYNRPMADHLHRLFPRRLQVIWGDSRETLPEFLKQHPDVKCDLIVIDGGHRYDVVKSDLENFKQMANNQNVLLMDDYFLDKDNGISDVWSEAKKQGDVAEIFTCTIGQGFAVGRIIV